MKVITYINIWLTQLYFALKRNIIKYRNINLILFSSSNTIFFIINIYLDVHQTVLKCLNDIEVNICNILIMMENFNIRDSDWSSFYSHYPSYSNTLIKAANSFDLKLFSSVNQVLIWYTDNSNSSNSVINLVFIWPDSIEINNHFILPKSHMLSDHAFLQSIYLSERSLFKIGNIQSLGIVKKKKSLSLSLWTHWEILIHQIPSRESLEEIIQKYTRISDSIWYKISKNINITKCSKAW